MCDSVITTQLDYGTEMVNNNIRLIWSCSSTPFFIHCLPCYMMPNSLYSQTGNHGVTLMTIAAISKLGQFRSPQLCLSLSCQVLVIAAQCAQNKRKMHPYFPVYLNIHWFCIIANITNLFQLIYLIYHVASQK